ncbi:MAG: DUF3710 domain-containing protein [Actinomycetaceae bacterium]|nr:DUF3710 domain-containing protein [Actinomycetaceae bacterium]
MAWFFRKKKTDDAEEAAEVTEASVAQNTPTTGPFDEADHPQRGALLDAGSLWLPKVAGVSIQFPFDNRRKEVRGILYSKKGGMLQLQAYAAPRSRGLWHDVRTDMITSIAKQGGSSKEVDGPFGTELHAQMPVPNVDQPQPHRFIGIDGPRWLLRATLYGRAATNQQLADEMFDIVRRVVVVRGQDPHPPRDLLPLTVPKPAKKK